MEIRSVTAKGRQIRARNLCEVDISEGKVARLRNISQDIATRKEAEQALQEREAFNHALFRRAVFVDCGYLLNWTRHNMWWLVR